MLPHVMLTLARIHEYLTWKLYYGTDEDEIERHLWYPHYFSFHLYPDLGNRVIYFYDIDQGLIVHTIPFRLHLHVDIRL
jgi:hypothetical protein